MPSDPPKTPLLFRGRASIEQSCKSVFRMDGQLLELLGDIHGLAKRADVTYIVVGREEYKDRC